MTEESLENLVEEIRQIKERLLLIEKEQRWIREDILSGNPTERMHKRILSNTEKTSSKKEKIDDDIKIEI
jgi:hypothetical protein